VKQLVNHLRSQAELTKAESTSCKERSSNVDWRILRKFALTDFGYLPSIFAGVPEQRNSSLGSDMATIAHCGRVICCLESVVYWARPECAELRVNAPLRLYLR